MMSTGPGEEDSICSVHRSAGSPEGMHSTWDSFLRHIYTFYDFNGMQRLKIELKI